MTREEAIERIEQLKRNCQNLAICSPNGKSWALQAMALSMALSALRPVSREQVEKVWRGKWIKELRQTYIPVEYDEQGEVILHDFVVYHCSICGRENTKEEPFCNCGAPMTDEAVDILLRRADVVIEDIRSMPTLTPPNEWVSVYDRLPEPGERVLATDCGFVGEFYINKRGKWQRYNVNCSELLMALDILYWMPLPAPPTKEE